MEGCHLDGCQRQEWLRLRKLRLLQVRDQSKMVSQETLRRSRETQEKSKAALRSEREKVLEEWKREKIKDLEIQYNEAMEKVGLANKAAASAPDADVVVEERRVRNSEIAAKRGYIAKQRQWEMEEYTREKENAPLRRKEMTRNIEDIRSGLVVQSRDWAVINQMNRKVLLDIPTMNVNDFKPREPLRPLPITSKLASPRSVATEVSKSPKSSRGGRHQPYPVLSTRSPKNQLHPSLKDSNNSSREKKTPHETDVALKDFHDQLARCADTYRLNEKMRNNQENFADSAAMIPERPLEDFPQLQQQSCPCASAQQPISAIHASDTRAMKTRPIVDLCTSPRNVNIPPCNCSNAPPSEVEVATAEDKELDLLLQKYRSSQATENKAPSLSHKKPPTESKGKSSIQKNPVKEKVKESPVKKTLSSRSNPKSPKKVSQKNSHRLSARKPNQRNETQKLLKQVDKALEEGRRLGEKISKCPSPEPFPEGFADSLSGSDSDSDAVVKLIVNVNCRTETEQGTGRSENPVSETRTVGTAVGDSLEEKLPVEEKSQSKRRVRRPPESDTEESVKGFDARMKCKCRRRCCNCPLIPIRRTSTVADLPNTRVECHPPAVDISSIMEEGQDVGVQTSFKSVATGESHYATSQSAWSSTVYMSPPTKDNGTIPEAQFKFNPVLDYYIRKLLDMPPTLRGSSCSDCDCEFKITSQIGSTQSTPSQTPHKLGSGRNLVQSKSSFDKDSSQKSNTQESLNKKEVGERFGQAIRKTLGLQPFSDSTASSGDLGNTHYKSLASFEEGSSGDHKYRNNKSLMSVERQKSFEEESERRLRRIAELKMQLEEIRKEQENVQFTSSSGSPESSSSGKPVSGSGYVSSYSGYSDKRKVEIITSSANEAAQLTKQFQLDQDAARRLSTILEIDSKLQLSEDSILKDPMNELLRRKLITEPFDWSTGLPLSDVSSESSCNSQIDVTFHTLPGQNISTSSVSSSSKVIWAKATDLQGKESASTISFQDTFSSPSKDLRKLLSQLEMLDKNFKS